MEEYRSVRSRVGLLDFCYRALLRFTGPDRIPYLQGMVSNDVEKLPPTKGMHAAVLNLQGRILADVGIFCLEGSLLMDLQEPLKDKIVSHLNRYLIADEVEIEDLTTQYGMVSLQGPSARELLDGFLTQELPSGPLDHCQFQTDEGSFRGDPGHSHRGRRIRPARTHGVPIPSRLHASGEG